MDKADQGRVLVVEDDDHIREFMITQLRQEAYAVASADTVAKARAAVARTAYDLIILDLNLPDGDGLDLCRQFRAGGFDGALMMVTARGAPLDRIVGLEGGADDYLAKPFEPREFMARVRNLFRRFPEFKRQSAARNARVAHFGPWRLDLHQRRLITPADQLVMLSAAEYRLLRRFIDAHGRVLSRSELSPDRSATAPFDRSIDLQISRLRQKLATAPGGADVILTVRSEGYVMPGPVTFE